MLPLSFSAFASSASAAFFCKSEDAAIALTPVVIFASAARRGIEEDMARNVNHSQIETTFCAANENPNKLRRMKFPLAIFLACFCSTAFGGFEWEQTEIALTAKPTDDHVDAVFHFKNTGDKPVTLKNAEAWCDCLAASADLRTYKPGESGEIAATFYVENHRGENRKGIDVLTDDPAEPQRTLFFTVFIG